MNIGFIGLGNMAGAMIGGLRQNKTKDEILGFDLNVKLKESRKKEFGITVCADNRELAQKADYIVLAVKPQFLTPVLEEIDPVLDKKKVIISIVAGKSLGFLSERITNTQKIVRCMPNTAALVGAAITAVTPSEKVSENELKKAVSIIESFGKASVVPERLMDAVTGVSGSSPAYVFMFIEAMADAAVLEGMPRAQAYEFAANAVYGSAKLMIETGKHPGELKDMVTSPAGTTIEGVKALEDGAFRATVMEAVIAAAERSKEL
ncbi:MAG: pyrroline-5-carboxylate reductase [Lachnospiraceae bacterium]|nr:pyrroline-5-carboxylate reductase [Lachnospiraceae bacterium]